MKLVSTAAAEISGVFFPAGLLFPRQTSGSQGGKGKQEASAANRQGQAGAEYIEKNGKQDAQQASR